MGATRGGGVWFVGAYIVFVANDLHIATIVFGVLVLIFAGIMYYKNVSFVIAKRLLREPNVVMLLVFGLCNWMIDIMRPATSFSPILGLIYLLVVSAIVFLDAVKVKSRCL